MKLFPRSLLIIQTLLLVGCQHAIDVLTPNTLQQFDNLHAVTAYKKQDVYGDSIFIEVGILESYLYLSGSKTKRVPFGGNNVLAVSVYCSRTPDEEFIRTPNGTFLKKIWTEAQITDDKVFYKDDAGLHEVAIKKWNSDFAIPYSSPQIGDPFSFGSKNEPNQ